MAIRGPSHWFLLISAISPGKTVMTRWSTHWHSSYYSGEFGFSIHRRKGGRPNCLGISLHTLYYVCHLIFSSSPLYLSPSLPGCWWQTSGNSTEIEHGTQSSWSSGDLPRSKSVCFQIIIILVIRPSHRDIVCMLYEVNVFIWSWRDSVFFRCKICHQEKGHAI